MFWVGWLVGILVLVLATASIGKVLGTVIVAKMSGVDLRKSFALGFLMNTKGLVELIVLNIGLSKGVSQVTHLIPKLSNGVKRGPGSILNPRCS
jgi:Kef-type K+ transport system membrane component KefB